MAKTILGKSRREILKDILEKVGKTYEHAVMYGELDNYELEQSYCEIFIIN